MTPRELVVAEARRWLDTPYHHQAFVRGVGVDCIGLIGGVALALGLPGAEQWRDTPEYHNYSRQPDPRLLVAGIDLLLDTATGATRLGDVLVIRFHQEPQHFAIVSNLEPLRMIHSLSTIGYVAENGINEMWRRRIWRVCRYRGVD